ncbi:hypothetical protein M434DRAFT_27887 [Hypoxylon sp. CO27-5]|nr:hypothetical protein M434DRAFT_27887 [Hypoxylon sp. CO27-5]
MTPKPTIVGALFIASLVDVAAAAAFENFTELGDGALFSPNDQVYRPGFGPRWYASGVPAGLANRQDQTPLQCTGANHVCLEVGPAGADRCCSSNQYCYLDENWSVGCCGLGTTCGPCRAQTLQYCNSTITSTTTLATSGTVTAVEQTTVTSGCCAKPCSTSSYLCQSIFGGQCCAYGASCATGGSCFFPDTTSISTIVTPVPSGCTTSQISCSTGGGCCNIGSTCVESTVSGTQITGLCQANLTVVDTGGLSQGARVGIGVGVAVGAAIVIGAITWFWISRRRKAKSATVTGSGPDGQQMADELREPFMRGTNTEITTPSSRMGFRPPLHETGLAYGYYGPDAVAGPFTDSSTLGGSDPRSSPRNVNRATLPATGHPNDPYPNNPSDIMRPVELDAQARAARAEAGESGVGAGEDNHNSTKDASITEVDQGPFELVGSPPTSPPPMTAEEAELRRSRAISPEPEQQPKGEEGKK